MTTQNRTDMTTARLAALALLGAAASASLGQTCGTNAVFPSSPALVPGPGLDFSAGGDMDGDGDPDIIAVNFGGSTPTVFLNDGAGAFTEHDSGVTGVDSIRSLALEDIDNDGVLDLVIAGRLDPSTSTQVASWYRGVGDGTFGPLPNAASSNQATSVLVSDLDLDGDLDMVGVATSSLRIHFYLNDGTGVFSEALDYPYLVNANSLVDVSNPVDLNGDGYPDPAFPGNAAEWEVAVILSNGAGQYLPPRFYDADPNEEDHIQGLELADLDGDGDIDMVYSVPADSDALVPQGLWVRFNDGAGTFSEPTVYPGDFVRGIVSADFDGDGDTDIVARESVGGPEDERFRFFRNNGSGDLSDSAEPVPLVPGQSWFLRMQHTGDFDGNGAPDLVIPHSRDGLLIAYNACAHPPVIDRQPGSIIAEAGTTAAFSIALTGSAPATYQWRRDGQSLTDGDGVSGSHSPHLTIASVTLSDVGRYDCVVENAFGARISSPAVLAVVAAAGPACSADLVPPFGAVNFFDLLEYVARYNAGCP